MSTIAILTDGKCILHSAAEILRQDYDFTNEFIDVNGGYGGTKDICQKADLIIFDFRREFIGPEHFSSVAKDFVFLAKAITGFKPFTVFKKEGADKSIEPLLNSMVSNKEISAVIKYATFTDFIKKVREEIIMLKL